MAPFALTEIEGDLFAAPGDVSLAHCVAADLRMGAGIAVKFKSQFQGVGELQRQNVKTGGVAILKHEDRFVYYLVTKEKSSEKPTLDTLSKSLEAMRNEMREHKVRKLAIPRLGCGLDGLQWKQVSAEIRNVFDNEDDVEITVYNFVPK